MRAGRTARCTQLPEGYFIAAPRSPAAARGHGDFQHEKYMGVAMAVRTGEDIKQAGEAGGPREQQSCREDGFFLLLLVSWSMGNPPAGSVCRQRCQSTIISPLCKRDLEAERLVAAAVKAKGFFPRQGSLGAVVSRGCPFPLRSRASMPSAEETRSRRWAGSRAESGASPGACRPARRGEARQSRGRWSKQGCWLLGVSVLDHDRCAPLAARPPRSEQRRVAPRLAGTSPRASGRGPRGLDGEGGQAARLQLFQGRAGWALCGARSRLGPWLRAREVARLREPGMEQGPVQGAGARALRSSSRGRPRADYNSHKAAGRRRRHVPPAPNPERRGRRGRC